MSSNKWPWALLILAVVAAVIYNRLQFSDSEEKVIPRIAFIVGGPDPFWEVVILGAKQSAKDNNADLTVIVPAEGGTNQTEKLMTFNHYKYEGVAISPLEPEKQARRISFLATRMMVVTYDNDAPESLRHCHVGTNNYVAGRRCGELVKEALPDGGTIALFVGDHTRQNARLRRQGFVDALKNENRPPGFNLDPLGETIMAGDFTIVETYLDGSVTAKAEENARKALQEHPELSCMVGMYGYNGPMCLKALEQAGRLGEVVVVAFDEHTETLDAIEAGNAFGTVVQDPFQYGYEAVRLLVSLSQRKAHAIPFAGSGAIYLGSISVKNENLAEFRSKMEKRRAGVVQ